VQSPCVFQISKTIATSLGKVAIAWLVKSRRYWNKISTNKKGFLDIHRLRWNASSASRMGNSPNCKNRL